MGISQEIKNNTKCAASEIANSLKRELVSGIQNDNCDMQGIAARGIKKGFLNWMSRSATGRAIQRIAKGTSTLDDFFDVADTLNPLFAVAHHVMESMRHGSCEQLRYDDMIKGALQNKPEDPAVVGCCVLQEPADKYTRVVFIYIDENDEPVFGNLENGSKPYGFYLMTKSFDDELNAAFDGQDMLVLKK